MNNGELLGSDSIQDSAFTGLLVVPREHGGLHLKMKIVLQVPNRKHRSKSSETPRA